MPTEDQRKVMEELVELIHAASIIDTTDIGCVGRALKETHHGFWNFIEKEEAAGRHPSEALYGTVAGAAMFARSMVSTFAKPGEEAAMMQSCIQTFSAFLTIQDDAVTLTDVAGKAEEAK